MQSELCQQSILREIPCFRFTTLISSTFYFAKPLLIFNYSSLLYLTIPVIRLLLYTLHPEDVGRCYRMFTACNFDFAP